MVTGEDEHMLRSVGINEVNVLGNCICSSAVYIQICGGFLTGRKYIDTTFLGIQAPASAGSYITVQKNGFILSKYAYDINSAVCTVAQWKIDDTVFTAVGDSRFCDLACKVMKTGSTASSQDHCQHIILLHIMTPHFL